MHCTLNDRIAQVTDETLVVGIDIGSEKHYARAFTNRAIEVSRKPFSFANSGVGYQRFGEWVERLREAAGKARVMAGLEPTGHYWFTLADDLRQRGYELVLVAPQHVKHSKEMDDNTQRKDDRKDPGVIAKLVTEGRYLKAYRPEGVYAELRVAFTRRCEVTEQMTRISNRIRRWFDINFPEYREVYGTITAMSGLMVLRKAPLPKDIVSLGAEGVNRIWRDAKLRAIGMKRAMTLVAVAERSIGSRHADAAARMELWQLLDEWELCEKQQVAATELLAGLVAQVPNADKLLAIPGIGLVTVAGFLAEVGDISRFNDPKGMVRKLHEMGFKVILWMVPFVTMDTMEYRLFERGLAVDDSAEPQPVGGLLGTPGKKDDPAAVKWWCGKSALLDLTHPRAREWFKGVCDGLMRDYAVDGFKFDGGHLIFYNKGYETYRPATPGEQVMEYAKFNLLYPLCEYRNAWKFQGQPVVERLHDKHHTWDALRKLIPDLVAGGLLGHPFLCPDMIAGGSAKEFLKGAPLDPELFVRSAQLHALCGMMQFSASPWRCLDAEKQQIIRDTVALRQKFAARFVELAAACGRTGEPMLRNLEYMFPGRGYAGIKDEFMMGDFLLVAPVLEKGAVSRKVVIPPGKWLADDGKTVLGPAEIDVATPLSRLPHFVLMKETVQ